MNPQAVFMRVFRPLHKYRSAKAKPEGYDLYLVSENLRLRPKSCVVVG